MILQLKLTAFLRASLFCHLSAFYHKSVSTELLAKTFLNSVFCILVLHSCHYLAVTLLQAIFFIIIIIIILQVKHCSSLFRMLVFTVKHGMPLPVIGKWQKMHCTDQTRQVTFKECLFYGENFKLKKKFKRQPEVFKEHRLLSEEIRTTVPCKYCHTWNYCGDIS